MKESFLNQKRIEIFLIKSFFSNVLSIFHTLSAQHRKRFVGFKVQNVDICLATAFLLGGSFLF